jgi:tetratricopeptide (TPR) repeat protein
LGSNRANCRVTGIGIAFLIAKRDQAGAQMTQTKRPSNRIFPVATSTLYEAHATATTVEPVGQAVLALARAAFPQLAGVAGFGLSPMCRLGRLLMFHKLAIDAETRQMPRGADFFWREAMRQLEVLWRDDTVWRETIAVQPIHLRAFGAAVTPDRLREAVLCELFADTHWGFYKAHCCANADPDNRGFAHLEYLTQLVTRISPLDAARTGAIARAMRGLAAICLRHKRWPRAEQVASILIERFDDGEEHQNLLAAAICGRAVDEMKDQDDEASAKHDAERMKGAAIGLEALRDRFGRNTLLFGLLGGVHFRQAVALANSGQLADALVAIQKALTFDPSLEGAPEAREDMLQATNELRDQAQALQPLQAFITSAEAARIVADWRIAHGHAIWRSLGLSPVQASNEQAVSLYDALASTLQRANGDPGELESAWDAAIQQSPKAAWLDRSNMLAWLRWEFDGTAASRVADRTTDDAASWPSEVEAFALGGRSGKRDREPAAEWLFSSQSTI